MDDRHTGEGPDGGARTARWRRWLPVAAVVAVAAVLAVALDLDVFSPLGSLGSAASADGGAGAEEASGGSGGTSVPEPSETLAPLSAGGVTVQVPDNWVEVDVAGVKGASPTSAGDVARVTADTAETSAMGGVPSVSSADDMEALARTVSSAQGGSADADVAVEQGSDGLWRATLPLREGDMRGTELLLADGGKAYVVEGVWSPDAPAAVVDAVKAAVASAAVGS